MNQEKIGKFIAECRKQEGLTQMQLAERLNVTDRAVSKWETGRAMPDSSIMLDLCNVLKISIGDLFNGGKLSMENKKEELEKELLQMLKKKEEADKRLLRLEVVVGVTMFIIFFTLAMIASLVTMDDWLRIVLILIGVVPLFLVNFVLLRIEQVAGYYECQECKHRYVPTYKAISLAQHLGRTRKMTCPKCGKKSWQKKVVSKTED